MEVKILIIDDHAAIIEGYKAMLAINKAGHTIDATVVYNCEEAFAVITNPKNATFFDIVFLDYSLPGFPAQKIKNGEDLGVLIRQFMPKTSIVMLTSHSEAILLFNLVKKIKPNGLIIKSDLKPQELLVAFEQLLNGEDYFSHDALERIKQPLLAHGNLDSIDRSIILLIAEGFQIKSIAEKLNISEETVKKRKSKIKDLIGVEKAGDGEFIKACKKLFLI